MEEDGSGIGFGIQIPHLYGLLGEIAWNSASV